MSNDRWKWFTPILMITTIVGFSWYLWNSSDDLDFKILKQPQPSQRETSISKPVTPEYPIPQLMDTILDDEDLKILPPLDQSDSYFILAIEAILSLRANFFFFNTLKLTQEPEVLSFSLAFVIFLIRTSTCFFSFDRSLIKDISLYIIIKNIL